MVIFPVELNQSHKLNIITNNTFYFTASFTVKVEFCYRYEYSLRFKVFQQPMKCLLFSKIKILNYITNYSQISILKTRFTKVTTYIFIYYNLKTSMVLKVIINIFNYPLTLFHHLYLYHRLSELVCLLFHYLNLEFSYKVPR